MSSDKTIMTAFGDVNSRRGAIDVGELMSKFSGASDSLKISNGLGISHTSEATLVQS